LKYLVSIAIGPVQDFISTARRSRDLWFGSWLLSELSKAAAHAIVGLYKKESLIFPSIDDPIELVPDSDFNVVNKLLAEVETNDLPSVMSAVKHAVDRRLEELRKSAFPVNESTLVERRAIAQVKDLVEFFWAAVPLRDYKKSREQVEALLIARKNTRDFISTREWTGPFPKSSLDGQRESVIDENAYPTREDGPLQRAAKTRHLFERYHARPGERLCGVGLLKRLGNRSGDDSFFSTSHVAALPLMHSLTDAGKVQEYIAKLKEIGVNPNDLHGVPLPSQRAEVPRPSRRARPQAFVIPPGEKHSGRVRDGHILFEERLRDYFETESGEGKGKLERAKQALRAFLKNALPGSMGEPVPYYALLHADGDGMGKAIEARSTKKEHQALSAGLSGFAKGVVKIVEVDHQGSLVYSGGDDVLAFLPLHTALDCASTLAKDFSQKLTEFKDENGRSPTLSVGIAITHHIEPLSDALELARDAEKEAKRLPGKNALCIKVSKRSGETTTVAGHWGNVDGRLRFFTLLHIADKLPDGVAYELRCLAEQLKYASNAVIGEVRRILKRKRPEHGQEELDEKVLAKLESALAGLSKTTNGASPLVELADELIVARMLAAGCEQTFETQDVAKASARTKLEQLSQDPKVGSEG
jgi:CRISPR-associated protein Cmr2